MGITLSIEGQENPEEIAKMALKKLKKLFKKDPNLIDSFHVSMIQRDPSIGMTREEFFGKKDEA
jgi:hypothetical protein